MAAPDTATSTRIAALEAQVRDLTQRITTLESMIRNSPRIEHPLDRDTVREKVAYDWQS
jgi:hypothetical protein